jgi:predicted Zn-dependent protease
MLNVNGRFEDAKRQLQRAREIDPLSQTAAGYSLMPLYGSRAYDDAIRVASRLLEAEPGASLIRYIRGQAHLMAGDARHAVEDLRVAAAAERQPIFLVYLARAARAAGDETAAERARAEVLRQSEAGYVQPYTLAVLRLTFGEREEALRLLERAVDERTEEVAFLKVDPTMDPLRSEPRFQALLRRLRFLS